MLKIFVLVFLATSLSYGQTLPDILGVTDFCIGKSVIIESDQLKEARTLNIYLPLGYSNDSTRKYPVIYLLDGSSPAGNADIYGENED